MTDAQLRKRADELNAAQAEFHKLWNDKTKPHNRHDFNHPSIAAIAWQFFLAGKRSRR